MPAPPADDRLVCVTFHEGMIGGASASVLRAIPELERLGWRFCFYVDTPGEMADRLREQGYVVGGSPRAVGFSTKWLMVPPGPRKLLDTPRWFRGWARFLREQRPAVVHANSLYTLPEALQARALGHPVFQHVHEMLAPTWKSAAARRVMQLAGLEVAGVSRSCAEVLGGNGPAPRIVYESSVIPEHAAERPDDPDPLKVGSIGWISSRKGSDLFVEAARRVHREMPDVVFELVGPAVRETPEWEFIQQVIADAPGAGVDYLGRVDGMAKLYDWDVYVQPSRFDPFPLAVLEAMATGVPVVCTAVDGMVEQVDGGAAGLLAAPEDPDDLAARILELLRDGPRRRELGAVARRRVTENFSDAHQARALDEAYRATIARRRR